MTWPEFQEEMILQFGPDELEDPMAASANLKQTDSVIEYHKAFIMLAHLVDDSEKNLMKVKMDRPLTMIARYRCACAREMIVHTERKLNKYQSYKSPNSSSVQPLAAAKSLISANSGKVVNTVNQAPSRDTHLHR